MVAPLQIAYSESLKKTLQNEKKIVVLEGDSFEIETLKGRMPGILEQLCNTKLSVIVNKLCRV